MHLKYILRYHAHTCSWRSGASTQIPRRDNGPSERRKDTTGSCKAGSLVVFPVSIREFTSTLRLIGFIQCCSRRLEWYCKVTALYLQFTALLTDCCHILVSNDLSAKRPFCFCRWCWSNWLNQPILVCNHSVYPIPRTAIGHKRAAAQRKSAYGMLTRTK